MFSSDLGGGNLRGSDRLKFGFFLSCIQELQIPEHTIFDIMAESSDFELLCLISSFGQEMLLLLRGFHALLADFVLHRGLTEGIQYEPLAILSLTLQVGNTLRGGFNMSATQNLILDSCQKFQIQVCTVLRRNIAMKNAAISVQTRFSLSF